MIPLFFLAGCRAADSAPSPSDSRQLNAVSPMQEKSDGFLQSRFDRWEQEEWTPLTETETREAASDDAVAQVESNDSFEWGLQYQLEKMQHYLGEKERRGLPPSHTKKINAMPVIGR